MLPSIKRQFAFFGGKISSKYGEKCCKYGLNGQKFNDRQIEDFEISMADLITGWRVNEDKTSLYRYFYTEDYLSGVNFMNKIVEVDEFSTRNQPEFHFKNGNLLQVNLKSHTLKGLS